jgi:hypothetical protein
MWSKAGREDTELPKPDPDLSNLSSEILGKTVYVSADCLVQGTSFHTI